jgi:glycosyltransferase involved in cell wall biosynthesis
MERAQTEQLELSVVMPILNAAPYLRDALDSVVEQDPPFDWEVVVADNGSTDGSLEIAESYRTRLPHLTIVDASDHRGRMHAVNKGVHASRGRKVVFLDGDDMLAPGYLLAMSEALRHDEIVCARTDVVTLNSPHVYRLRPSSQWDGPMNGKRFLPWGGGGTLGVTRRLFDAIGGFELSAGMLEDIDFCWRAQLDGGARLGFAPDAVLRHRYRADTLGVFHQTRKWSREEAKLRQVYEPRGMPPLRSLDTPRSLWSSMRQVRRLRTPAGRYRWFKNLGHAVGGAEGRMRLRASRFRV